MLSSEIHHQTFQVYGDNAMSDGMVRKWVRMFNEGWENVHNEVRSGRPSLVQADELNKEDYEHCILGQTRCPLGTMFAPRHNNKLCCLLWNTEEAEACNSKGAKCWVPPFFCFTITLGRTLLLRLKTLSPHLGGNKWTTPVQRWFGAKWFSPLPTPKKVPWWQAIWRRRWPDSCSAGSG